MNRHLLLLLLLCCQLLPAAATGHLDSLTYQSAIGGHHHQRQLMVYLPQGYAEADTLRYPVLYLLHGSGGDEHDFLRQADLPITVDRLTDAGTLPPMIVVMSNDNADIAERTKTMTGEIEAAFPTEVVATVDANYRTMPDRQHRAIAGVSLGGLHTLYIVLDNPQLFGYVGLFSAQTRNPLAARSLRSLARGVSDAADALPFGSEAWKDRLRSKADKAQQTEVYDSTQVKLQRLAVLGQPFLYLAVGRQDYCYKLVSMLRKDLDAAALRYTYEETDMRHNWVAWRRYLNNFLPHLWK